MSTRTHDGWLRAAPAMRTHGRAAVTPRPAARARVRSTTPGRAPYSAMTTTEEITSEHADVCSTCHLSLPTDTGKCDGLWH